MPGFLSRLLGRGAPTETRDMLGAMHGFMPGYVGGFGGHMHTTGTHISPVAAENLAAVGAAVSAISTAIASLQPLAFRREGTGRTELAPPHWLARLIREPAPRTSWAAWMEQQIGAVLLTGNAIAILEADVGGRVIALHPVRWGDVAGVVRLPSGRLRYDITDSRGAWGRTGAVHGFFEDQIWHLADRLEPGEVAARPRLGRVGGAIANAISLQTMASAAWENATHIGGVITAPNILTTPQRSVAELLLQRFQGARNAGKPVLLEGGWGWQPATLNAESLETLESRKFSVIEIARAFNIPPPLLQSYENNTFTNSQQASFWFGMFTIAPWVRKIESAFQTCVFGPQSDLLLECDMSSLLRGSQSERWEANRAAIELGVVSADEIRQQEGWGPRPTATGQPQPVAAPQPAEAPAT